jgi:hypothetical protein
MLTEINTKDIVELLLFAAAIAGVYVRLQVKLKELDMKIIALELRVTKTEQEDHEFNKKLDQIMSLLTEIRIEVTKKQDRQ